MSVLESTKERLDEVAIEGYVKSIVDTGPYITVVDELPEYGRNGDLYIVPEYSELREYTWIDNQWNLVGKVNA